MAVWNYDMDAAPRGEFVKETRRIGKNDVEVAVHRPVQIIAAGNDNVVTLSRWLPGEGRWNMFSAKTPPIAWMPWPEHPHAAKEADHG